MMLQKDFLIVSPKKIIHRLIVTDKGVYDQLDTDTILDALYYPSRYTVITQSEYDEMIKHLCSIIYGKFADPETPLYDLVNSFKYIHNTFLNSPCID